MNPQEAISYPGLSSDEILIRQILPDQVVCGDNKDCFKTSCYQGGVRSIHVDYALAYKYVRYGTTFERHNKKYPEIINSFIIDVDYKFKPTLQEAHDFVTDNIIPPTFTTQTDKGYQFIYGLASSFVLNPAGEAVARNLNERIMKMFTGSGINIDQGASSRLIGTFRNPLAHDYLWHNKLYNSNELYKRMPEEIKTLKSAPTTTPITSTGINPKALDQAKVISDGFIKGNRNNHFFLYANKATVEGKVTSFNEVLMICRNVASNLETDVAIPDTEVKATARQLWRYKQKNELFMPRVFCTGTAKANAGKYRLELNATVGFGELRERRAASMKLVHRDRKLSTKQKIINAVKQMDPTDFEQKKMFIYEKIATLSATSTRTVIRHIKEDISLLTSQLKGVTDRKYVLDYLSPNVYTGARGVLRPNVDMSATGINRVVVEKGVTVAVSTKTDEVIMVFDDLNQHIKESI